MSGLSPFAPRSEGMTVERLFQERDQARAGLAATQAEVERLTELYAALQRDANDDDLALARVRALADEADRHPSGYWRGLIKTNDLRSALDGTDGGTG